MPSETDFTGFRLDSLYCSINVKGLKQCTIFDCLYFFFQHVLGCFGVDRCMYGSDWPVCNLAKADYKTVFNLLQRLLGSMAFEDKKKIFRLNAAEFYKLDL